MRAFSSPQGTACNRQIFINIINSRRVREIFSTFLSQPTGSGHRPKTILCSCTHSHNAYIRAAYRLHDVNFCGASLPATYAMQYDMSGVWVMRYIIYEYQCWHNSNKQTLYHANTKNIAATSRSTNYNTFVCACFCSTGSCP